MSEKLEKQMRQLRQLGFKLTPQRKAVLRLLDGNTSHPSVDQMYTQLKKNFPTIARATVYNTVGVLAKNGMLLELPITKTKRHYDPDTSDHDHAFCTRCGTIIDVFPTPSGKNDEEDHQNGPIDFNVHSVRKVFYGLCAICESQKG